MNFPGRDVRRPLPRGGARTADKNVETCPPLESRRFVSAGRLRCSCAFSPFWELMAEGLFGIVFQVGAFKVSLVIVRII